MLIHAHSGKDDISNHRINRDLSERLRAENPMKRVSTRVAPREVDREIKASRSHAKGCLRARARAKRRVAAFSARPLRNSRFSSDLGGTLRKKIRVRIRKQATYEE